MSQRNQEVHMVQNNTWDFVTFFQSVKGYGLFWDNYSPTTFKDEPGETFFRSDVGEGIDYYFMYGGDADGVVAQMRDLTGQVPMFPLWTYGYWQSKERYKSQNETVGVVRKYRELGVPLDGIIQDWQYWGNNYLWNAMEFLNEDFPNPQGMVRSEEHTSELQSRPHLVCRLLLEKKKKKKCWPASAGASDLPLRRRHKGRGRRVQHLYVRACPARHLG